MSGKNRVHVLDSFMFNQASLAGCCQSDRFEVTRDDARNERTIKALLKQADVVFPIFFDEKIGAEGDGQSIQSRDQKEVPPSGIFLV